MVDERSDGLRWFLALLGLLYSRQSTVKPILLVDEAEQHLSYDAQASLINVLETQDVVQKVIYTTHSAGCLPSDLGTGIRPVVPLSGQKSTIKNCFWQEGSGFSPLLMAMGLGPLAFTVARNELIGEGACECLLLPSLLREATGLTLLGFQVAPGASNTSKAFIGELTAECGRALFLLDGDMGGRERQKGIEDAGIAAERVKVLTDFREDGEGDLTIEDLVSKEALVKAVNQQMCSWQKADDVIAVDDLPESSRWDGVKKWCGTKEYKPPSKPMVCQELAAMAADGQAIVDPQAKSVLYGIYSWADRYFKKSTHSR